MFTAVNIYSLKNGGRRKKMVNHRNALDRSRTRRNDEFYTRDDDVVWALKTYSKSLRGRHLILPCDGPRSAFTRLCGEAGLDFEASTGDFESALSKAEQGSIVFTNPPFSIFAGFIHACEEARCSILCLGPVTAPSLRGLEAEFLAGELAVAGPWVKRFTGPDGEEKAALSQWYSTPDLMPEGWSKLPMPPFRGKPGHAYEEYENLTGGIEVPRIDLIPPAFEGKMGVPITIFRHAYEEDFELLGIRRGDDGQWLRIKGGRTPFARAIIQRKQNETIQEVEE